MSPLDSTVNQRLLGYQFFVRNCTKLIAALMGEVSLYASFNLGAWGYQSVQGQHSFFGAVFVTLTLIAIALLAKARTAIQWQIKVLEQYLNNAPSGNGGGDNLQIKGDGNIVEEVKSIPDKIGGFEHSGQWPPKVKMYKRFASWLLLINGVLFVGFVWVLFYQAIHVTCS